MAFSEEQETNILDTITKMNEFLSSQTKNEEKKDEETKQEGKELLDEAKKKMEGDTQKQADQSNIESALRFQMKIEQFAEDYKAILPSSVKSIIETANAKDYSTAIAKANDIRKAIIDAYLEVQANIDGLPETLKAKAKTYKTLTEEAKKEKSASFWEVVELGAEMAKAKARAKAINIANGSGNGEEENAFRGKFLSLGDKFKRKE